MAKKMFGMKPGGRRKVKRHRLRYLENVENDL
jgi:hypothetical protein